MKKLILILAANLMLNTFIDAQVAIEWQKCFGGSNQENATSMYQTTDGGYIVAGYTSSNNGNVTGNHSNNLDYWIVKLDSSGDIQWQKCFGGTFGDLAYSVQPTTDGGYIMGGISGSNDGDVTGNHNSNDCWVVKLDGIGNIQWQKSLGGTDIDQASSVQQTSDGGYMVVGYTISNDSDVTGNHGNYDYWVVKLYGNGNLQWQKCFGGTGEDRAFFGRQTFDGGYIIAGMSFSLNGNVTGHHGSCDYWIVKLDDSGNIQWQKSIGGTPDDRAYSVQQTTDGGFVVAGSSYSNDDDVTGNHGLSDYWVVKLDTTGNIEWQKSLGGLGYDVANSIQQTSEGGYIVAGYTNSNNGDVSGNHGDFDYWIVKLDGNGTIQWQKCLGGTDIEYAYSIQQIPDGSYVVAGCSTSNDGDVTGNYAGSGDFWIVKLTEHYNSITGKLYVDLNSNNIHELSEPILSNKKITEQNTNRFSFGNSNGGYELSVLDIGTYNVAAEPLNNFTSSPFLNSVYFSSIHQTDSLNDFAFQPNGVINDLCINITPLGNFRAGFKASYMITYENVGTTVLSPTVIFVPDNNVTFFSAGVSPTSITTDSVVWSFGPMQPFQKGSILVTVNVNTGIPVGTVIQSFVRIEPVAGDANPNCNYSNYRLLTTGSYDPNAIIVDEDTLLTIQLSNPPYLDYIIYFQNTGNDTAFTVKIYNPVDTNKLDINSLEFVAASHPVDLRYVFYEQYLKFTFSNILLPDSTINELMSHGFVRYKIKPKSNLLEGDSIKSTAYIYFDFNEAVVTNTAVTQIVLPSSVNDMQHGNQLMMYPNPASEKITIRFPQLSNGTSKLILTEISGRLLEQKFINSNQTSVSVDVSNLASGIYFLQLQSGEKLLRGKFVRE